MGHGIPHQRPALEGHEAGQQTADASHQGADHQRPHHEGVTEGFQQQALILMEEISMGGLQPVRCPAPPPMNARPALRRLPTRPSRMVQGLIRRLLPLVFRIRAWNSAAAMPRKAWPGLCSTANGNVHAADRLPPPQHPGSGGAGGSVLEPVPKDCTAATLLQPLPRPIELRFLYDRGIPIWAGPVIGWLLQRSGGIAIHRGRLDRPPWPRPAGPSPRGATRWWWHRKEPPTISPARWHRWSRGWRNWRSGPPRIWRKPTTSGRWRCCPLAFTTAGGSPNWTALDARFRPSNAISAFSSTEEPAEDPETSSRDRLIQIGMNLLKALEQLERLQPDPDQTFSERIGAYRLHGLAKAEAHFGLRAVGNLQERCRRIEQAAWDRIYREGC